MLSNGVFFKIYVTMLFTDSLKDAEYEKNLSD